MLAFKTFQIPAVVLLLALPYSAINADCTPCRQNGVQLEITPIITPVVVDSYQSPTCVKKHRHRRVKKRRPVKKANIVQVQNQINYKCKNPTIVKPCANFSPARINCQIINPADLVDSTCGKFKEKLTVCEAYSCQAPYALDPTVKTNWQILGKNGDRCIVSNTTEDIGIKDSDGRALPITQMCEYDKLGVVGLIERFIDQDGRYYHYSTCRHFEGIHNCTTNSRGRPIKDAMRIPAPEIDVSAGENS